LSTRILGPGDEAALDGFLANHFATSMILRANLRAAGLADHGEAFQGTYAAAFDRATIVAAAAHYWNGVLAVQAPRSLASVVRAAVAASKRNVTGFVGPWNQVEAAVPAVGRSQRRKLAGVPKTVMALDMTNLRVPAPLAEGKIRYRKLSAKDHGWAAGWRTANFIETFGAKNTPELRDTVAKETEGLIERGQIFTVETDRPLAIGVFDATLPNIVQLDGIWTPAAHRGQGPEAAAVAGALHSVKDTGVTRAVLLTPKSSAAAHKLYRALGFVAIADHGMMLYVD
jgi:predicted GNAT family acetyltransferase